MQKKWGHLTPPVHVTKTYTASETLADHFPGEKGAKLGPNDNKFQTRITVTDITSTRQHVKSKLLQVERILLKTLSISEKGSPI